MKIDCYQYRPCCRGSQRGFLADFYSILRKYSLESHINEYIISGTFPSKAECKQRCKTAIWYYEESAWCTLLAESNAFARFRTIQTELQPATLWTLALNRPDTLELCYFVVKLCSNMSAMSVCQSCNSITDDIIFHPACECSNVCVVSKRLQFRNSVSEKMGTHTSDILWNLQDEAISSSC